MSAWKALTRHSHSVRKLHLQDLFARDKRRGERFTAEAVGLFLDYSKNRITGETLRLLRQLAVECGLRAKIAAMFRGEKINATENRAVLHVALRAPRNTVLRVDGQNVIPEVHAVLNRMAGFADRVRSGQWKGHTGRRIRNVVNIGIGGSDLGPVMAYSAPALQRPLADLPLHLERGWRGFRRGHARARTGGDVVHHFVQDVHDVGNHDQCAERARLVVAGVSWRPEGGRAALRRRFDQCRKSVRVRH